MMGAIVSDHKQEVLEDTTVYPSAVTAARARIRHQLLEEHFRQINNAEEREETKKEEDYYPAGISSWLHREEEGNDVTATEEVPLVEMNWMDAGTLSGRELHDAALYMHRLFSDSRKAQRDQVSARLSRRDNSSLKSLRLTEWRNTITTPSRNTITTPTNRLVSGEETHSEAVSSSKNESVGADTEAHLKVSTIMARSESEGAVTTSGDVLIIPQGTLWHRHNSYPQGMEEGEGQYGVEGVAEEGQFKVEGVAGEEAQFLVEGVADEEAKFLVEGVAEEDGQYVVGVAEEGQYEEGGKTRERSMAEEEGQYGVKGVEDLQDEVTLEEESTFKESYRSSQRYTIAATQVSRTDNKRGDILIRQGHRSAGKRRDSYKPGGGGGRVTMKSLTPVTDNQRQHSEAARKLAATGQEELSLGVSQDERKKSISQSRSRTKRTSLKEAAMNLHTSEEMLFPPVLKVTMISSVPQQPPPPAKANRRNNKQVGPVGETGQTGLELEEASATGKVQLTFGGKDSGSRRKGHIYPAMAPRKIIKSTLQQGDSRKRLEASKIRGQVRAGPGDVSCLVAGSGLKKERARSGKKMEFWTPKNAIVSKIESKKQCSNLALLQLHEETRRTRRGRKESLPPQKSLPLASLPQELPQASLPQESLPPSAPKEAPPLLEKKNSNVGDSVEIEKKDDNIKRDSLKLEPVPSHHYTVEEDKEKTEEQGNGEEEEEEEEEDDDDDYDEDEDEEEEEEKVDSLVDLLYSELKAEGEADAGEVGGEGSTSSKAGGAGGGGLSLTAAVVKKIQKAVILKEEGKRGKEALPSKVATKLDKSDTEGSILMARPDSATMMKVGEFRRGTLSQLHHLTSAIRLDYYKFMSDYDETSFYSARQVEAALSNYAPQVVLDFHHETTNDILAKVKELLEGYKVGAKAKYLGIVCKGGPGHFYLVKKVPVTPQKIRSNPDLLEFWQELGNMMSKLVPGESVIHLMESNVAGNRKGEELVKDLEYALFSHQVKVQSPLEISNSGRAMLGLYFNTAKHKLWKMSRYTKLKLYK